MYQLGSFAIVWIFVLSVGLSDSCWVTGLHSGILVGDRHSTLGVVVLDSSDRHSVVLMVVLNTSDWYSVVRVMVLNTSEWYLVVKL